MPKPLQAPRPSLPSAGPPTLRDRVARELLPAVRQPAQYIGGEVNQLVRPGDWERAGIRVAVAFPDTYTIGMSHLGCQIIYWLCNRTPGVCAERVYCPLTDAEEVMRRRGLPLFTWDTRQPVREADILAISLQYELCFTSVLNLLDLAGVPVWARERTDDDPLVIAGGPQADNPEPMAEFLDLVVMGDGEHSMAGILEAVREYKRAGLPRRAMILEIARRFCWVYAPNYYEPRYQADGTLAEIAPLAEGLPARIERCKTPDFETSIVPERPLMPWVESVHDRISIEIMRGCPQVCRFCHAGYTKRPLRYRSVDRILDIAEAAWRATGYKEIGLLSLSTADYPLLPELARRINERFGQRQVNISLPSLRVDKMLQHIPGMANQVRKGSITMAVEAARDDLRQAIRKKVTDGNLLDGVREVYKAGWNRVKLYFMAGFPGEQEDDIDGIWDLAVAVSEERRAIGKSPAQVTASVGWLVPKPFTPLQWAPQARVEYFREVRRKLARLEREGARSEGARESAAPAASRSHVLAPADSRRHKSRRSRPKVHIQMHDPDMSVLEGVFARGDRRLGRAIYEAWRRGARLDGWSECFKPEAWRGAWEATGIDPDWYAHRERRFDEVLPWDHIGLHMPRSYLERAARDLAERTGPARLELSSGELPLLA